MRNLTPQHIEGIRARVDLTRGSAWEELGAAAAVADRAALLAHIDAADTYTREDLARAFDEGFEQGWAYRATNRADDPDNPYTKEEQV